jgi:hypothetical protein
VRKELFPLVLSFGVLATAAGACLSNSSSPASSGPDSGSASSSGGGSSGSSSGGTEAGTTCTLATGTLVPLTASNTGYVMVPSVNIVGAWFAYGDGLGANGAPPGQCETNTNPGPHPMSACSSITFPPGPPADGGTNSFPPDPPNPVGTMCLSGTAAQVIGTPPDYSNIFGIGIGFDFNDPHGTSAVYNAPMNSVIGFAFTVAGLPTGTGAAVRVEFTETATDVAPFDAWSYTLTGNGPTMVALASGNGPGQLSESFTPPTGSTEPPFDPTTVEAIQFHIVTNVTGPVDVTDFCISDFAAIVCQ